MRKKFFSLAISLLLITGCQPQQLSPTQVVNKMFHQLSQLRTASFSATAQIKSATHTQIKKFTQIFLSQGYLDLSDFNQPKIMLTGEIKSQPGDSFSIKGKLRITEGFIYLKTLRFSLDTSNLLLPLAINQWLELGKLYTKQTEITPTKQRKLRALLTTFNILKNIKEHPREKIGNKSLRHFSAKLNHQAFKKLLREAATITEHKIEDKYLSALEKRVQQAVFELWIGEKDFHLYQLETTFVITLNERENLNIRLSVKFWDFNQTKTIPQPPKAKKIDREEILSFYYTWLKSNLGF
jgi:hypothetical protein